MIRFITRCILTKRERNKIVITDGDLHGHGGLMLCAPWPGCWTIRVHPGHKNNAGLIAHEYDGHVADYIKNPWTYAIKMLFSRRYRWERETHYYAIQLLHSEPENLESRQWRYAGFIATRYRLRVTQQQAYDRLVSEYGKLV